MLNVNDTPGQKIIKVAILSIAWPYFAVENCNKATQYSCLVANILWLPVGVIPFIMIFITGIIVLISEKK